MQITLMKTDGKYTHVKLAGRMDIAGVQAIDLPFTAHVASARQSAIIDFSEVTFLASFGIRTLLTTAKALRREKASMVLVNPQSCVREVLMLAQLGDILHITDTVEQAKEIISTCD